jgi:hypothetical protein
VELVWSLILSPFISPLFYPPLHAFPPPPRAKNKELKILDISSNPKLQYNPPKLEREEDLFPLPKLQVLGLNELSPTITVSEKTEQLARVRRFGSDDTISNFGVADFSGMRRSPPATLPAFPFSERVFFFKKK